MSRGSAWPPRGRSASARRQDRAADPRSNQACFFALEGAFRSRAFAACGRSSPSAVASGTTSVPAAACTAGAGASFKTSGQSGLHVLVALGPGASYVTARALADLLGRLLCDAHPDIATMERRVDKRGPRVYADTGQTGPSRTIVAPWAVRARAGAPVSTPLRWEEVVPDLDPAAFTIRTVPARFEASGDPMAGMLSARPSVGAAVEKLARRVAAR